MGSYYVFPVLVRGQVAMERSAVLGCAGGVYSPVLRTRVRRAAQVEYDHTRTYAVAREPLVQLDALLLVRSADMPGGLCAGDLSLFDFTFLGVPGALHPSLDLGLPFLAVPRRRQSTGLTISSPSLAKTLPRFTGLPSQMAPCHNGTGMQVRECLQDATCLILVVPV